MIDLSGVPDLSDNVKKKILVSHLFGSTVFADFYLNSVIFFPIILHQGVPSFVLINVLHNCLFLVLN